MPSTTHPAIMTSCVPRTCRRVVLRVVAALLLGSAVAPSAARAQGSATVPVHADTARLRAAAQQLVDAFAAQVGGDRASALGQPPRVVVGNTPPFMFYDGRDSTNRVVNVPWWETLPPPVRAAFRTFAGETPGADAHLFRAFFNRFLIAHEAAHWFQDRASVPEPSAYAREDQANRLAVAFFRTQPEGERFLAELEGLAARAAASVPDPTPAGDSPARYFDANYDALGHDPYKYGYYQFRFMRDALRERTQLDLARMVRGVAR